VEYRLCRDKQFNAAVLDLILETLEPDKKMADDRMAASRANREAICKK
jgi:hypothetical protein